MNRWRKGRRAATPRQGSIGAVCSGEIAAVARYLEQLDSGVPPCGDVVDEFVENALRYSIRNGISTNAWRIYGVPANLLKQSGLDG